MAFFKQAAKNLSDAVIFRSVVTEDKHVMSILFDHLEVSLDSTEESGVRTRSVSIYIPVAENDTEAHLRVHIRGALVLQNNNIQALVLVQSGNTTTLIDPKVGEGNFFKEIETTLPPNSDFFLTLFLLVQHSTRDANSGSLLSVDSVDVEIGK